MEQPHDALATALTPVDRLSLWLGRTLAWVFLIAVALTAWEVLMRYVFNSPTIWVHDLVIALSALAFIFGGAYSLQRAEHIRISTLYDRMPPLWRRGCDLLNALAIIVFMAAFGWAACRQAAGRDRARRDQRPRLGCADPRGPQDRVGGRRRADDPAGDRQSETHLAAGPPVSIEWITILMFGSMIVMLLLGLPLAFVTGLIAAVFGMALFGPKSMLLISSRIYSFMNEYVLVSVPMFIMMASIMERSGVAKDLFDAMRVWAGRLPGGLAIQTMVAATIMGAMTGIIGGEIVLLGLVALPQMLRLGYDRKLAIGTICAGGSLGTMIPPSIVLVIYGLTVERLDRRSVRGQRDSRA